MQPPIGSGPGQHGYPPESLVFPPPSDPSQMQQLVDLLGSKVPTKSTAVVECPKTMVGRVIGKGGETIKALQQYTGAMIQIDQSSDPTRVTIAGLPQALQLAVSMVNDIVRGTFKGFAMLRQIALANASNPGMATFGQQHAPVYVQGYGFVPPSQAYGGEDPLASIFRTSSSGPVSPPISPMRGDAGFQNNVAAMLLGQAGQSGFGVGSQAGMAPPGHISPQHQAENAGTDAMLSQLLTQLSFNQQAAEAAATLQHQQQQHSPHAYAAQQQHFGTPPGTPGSGGGVLDAAGLQTLLAQAVLLGRSNMAGGQVGQGQAYAGGSPHAMGGEGTPLHGSLGGRPGVGPQGPGPGPGGSFSGQMNEGGPGSLHSSRDGSAGGLSSLLTSLGPGTNQGAQAALGPASGSPASSSPLTGSGRASPNNEAAVFARRGRSFTLTQGGEEAALTVPPSPLGDAARGGVPGSSAAASARTS